MPDDDVLERWLRHEMQRLNEPVVRSPRPLAELLRQAEPTAPARDGSLPRFDPQDLRALAGAVPPLLARELRLPIRAYLDHESPGQAFVTDEGAARALRALGVTSAEHREGRLWLSLALVRDYARAHPTLFQFVHR